MAFHLPSPYQIKKLILYPRHLYMRRKEKLEPGFMLSTMELHYYRPAIYRWLRARIGNEHLLHEADIDHSSTVLDVGAYTGEWAGEVDKLYQPTIYAFEPDPRNFKQLEKRASKNPKLRPFKYGLNDRNEQVRMTLEYLGSTAYADAHGIKGVDWEEAQMRDITEIWTELSLGQVDLMKINIEGGEFPLLERMIETQLIGQVRCYLIQFHEWHPGAYHRRRKIRRELRKTHRLVWDYHFVWEKWERK